MKLPPQLEKLSQIKYAKPIGLLLAIMLDMGLLLAGVMLGGNIGYYLMMVGLVAVTFVVPYLFGWRDGKMIAVMGIGVFLLIGAINGPLVVHTAFTTEQPDPVSSYIHVNWFTKSYEEIEGGNYTTSTAWYRLESGTQELYKGNQGQSYSFSVMLYSNDTVLRPVDMGYARGIWGLEGTNTMFEADPSDTNLLDGKLYYYEMNLEEPGIYSHWFAVVFDTGMEMNSLNTSVALGPLVGSETDNWGAYIPIGAMSMFCNIGLLFLIIVLLYWWLGTAKAKRRVWDDALREKEGESGKKDDKTRDDALDSKPFSCDQCGAPVGVNDNFCPKCGERFDGDEEDDEPESDGKASRDKPSLEEDSK